MMIDILASTLLYYDAEVDVIVLRNDVVELPGGLQIKLQRGTKVKLPFVVVKELEGKGSVKLDEEKLLDFTSVRKQTWMEEKTDGLSSLDENFYLRLKLYLYMLKRRVSSGDEAAQSLLEKMRIAFLDLLRLRLTKIVKLAASHPGISKEVMSSMTKEEQILYVSLCKSISEWTQSMKMFVLDDKYG
jgi:DNA replication factor GINS